MDEYRFGHSRPPRENDRPQVVAVSPSLTMVYPDREIWRNGRLRSARHVDAAFASLQELGVEILSGRPATSGPEADSLLRANGGGRAVPMGPLRRLLARSRG